MYTSERKYGPEIDYRYCKGCGECYKHCPMDIFGWDEEKQMPAVEYGSECSCCCFCEVMCPEAAIDVCLPLHQLLDFGIAPTALTKERRILSKGTT